MASSKDIYEAGVYAAGMYAAGVWRGLGVSAQPTFLTASLSLSPRLTASLSLSPRLTASGPALSQRLTASMRTNDQ